jgi:hypothetical protein
VQLNRSKTWFDRVLEDPKSAYGCPAEVLRDERLDEAGARAVLSAWESDVRRETMAGAETPELAEVWSAIAELDRREGLTSPP